MLDDTGAGQVGLLLDRTEVANLGHRQPALATGSVSALKDEGVPDGESLDEQLQTWCVHVRSEFEADDRLARILEVAIHPDVERGRPSDAG
jgi:hypothetical protein